jgi:hypothetical protein
MIQKMFSFKNAKWVSKNAEFDFESVEKVANNLMQKSYQRKSDSKIEF